MVKGEWEWEWEWIWSGSGGDRENSWGVSGKKLFTLISFTKKLTRYGVWGRDFWVITIRYRGKSRKHKDYGYRGWCRGKKLFYIHFYWIPFPQVNFFFFFKEAFTFNRSNTHATSNLPVVGSWFWHHLCCWILSNVSRFSGLGTRIFCKKLRVKVSSLLHGVIDV